MSERTTGRLPRRYTQGVFKNKRDIEKYRKIADTVMKQSKVYEKESRLAVVGIVIMVMMLSLTPFVIYFKNKRGGGSQEMTPTIVEPTSTPTLAPTVNPITGEMHSDII